MVKERPQVVIDILNANALERNLYLGAQFLQMGVPLVFALNMMDEVSARGKTINAELLAKFTGCPAIETVVRTDLGKDKLITNAINHAHQSAGNGNR